MILRNVGTNSIRLLVGLTILIMATAACGPFSNSKATVAPSPVGTPTATPRVMTQGTPVPAGPAPSPAKVSAASIVMIDRWREYQVPLYPGATQIQFTQLGQTVVVNGGSALYSSTDSPEKILAYYLGALPTYGWTKVSADSNKVAFKTKKASLSISVSDNNGTTNILMILGDV